MDNTILVLLGIAFVLLLSIILLAVLLYTRRVISDPIYYLRLMQRAELAHTQSKSRLARKFYLQIIKGIRRVKAPTPELLTILGNAYLALGNLDRGEQAAGSGLPAYREAIQLIPVPDDVVQIVAHDYAAHADMSSQALDAYFLQIANLRSSQVAVDPVLILLEQRTSVKLDADSKQIEFIAQLTRRLNNIDPRFDWSWFAQGIALARMGNQTDAIAALTQAEKLRPTRPDTRFHLGMLYLAQKNTDLAYTSFQRTLELNPDQPEALYQLAQLQVARAQANPASAPQELEDATVGLRRATALSPKRADIWYLFGQANLLCEKPIDARPAFTQAAEIEPKNVAYQMALAHLLLGLGEESASISAFRRAVTADPNHAPAHFNLAELLFKAQKYDETERHYIRALQLEPTNAPARIGLGRTLYEQDRLPEAIVQLSQVTQLDRPGLFTLARAYSRTNEFAKAIPLYDKWIQAYGDDTDGWFYLGCAHVHRGDWQSAIDAYQHAQVEAQTRGDARADIPLCLGTALLQVGQIEPGLDALQEAEKLAPGDPQAPYMLGLGALRQDNLDVAHAAFDRALAVNPNYAAPQFVLGMLEEKAGAYDKAAQRYARGLGLWPEWKWAQIRLGVVQAKNGEWSVALNTLLNAQTQDPGNGEILSWLGMVYAQQGKPEEALKTWEELRARHPGDQILTANVALVLYQLGRRCFDAGDYGGAINHWQRATQVRADVLEYRDTLVEAYLRRGVQFLFGADGNAGLCDQARKDLEQAAALKQEDPRPPYYMGLEAFSDGDAARAIQYWSPLARQYPTEHRYTYHLALAYLMRADTQSAVPLLERLAPFAEIYTPGLQVAKANTAALQENWEQAIVSYQQVLDGNG
jgi:tetratricopeptide (TPR) repeat protein